MSLLLTEFQKHEQRDLVELWMIREKRPNRTWQLEAIEGYCSAHALSFSLFLYYYNEIRRDIATLFMYD